ncbi:phage protease [Magnetospirillum sp. XM-1]|uniref:phage protease n=1 Tax=Magnetospirillum sp. XM-1 TaxID=1663591 RepID=UPI001560B9AD|nr:phage protease [Magnetospirillum sp. XM-1]
MTDEQGIALATAGATSLGESDVVVASAGLELPGGAPEWVKLLPYGTFAGRDGRGPYTLSGPDHAAQVIAASTAYQKGADLPFDYEHQAQLAAKNGQPVIASGWGKALEARPDGLYARIDWTETAAARLAAKECRYISPAFTHDPQGRVLRIVGGGLVAMPNLEIPALAHQDPAGQQGESMDPILKALLDALGLAAGTTPEAVAAHAQKMIAGHKAAIKLLGLPETSTPEQVATAAQVAIAGLAKTIGIEGDVTIVTLATAAQQLADKAKSAGTVDLTAFVPMAVHVAVASQLAELQGKVSTTDAEREVNDAVKAGKLTPAMKEWGLALASQSLDAFKAYIAKAPVLVATAGQTAITAPPPATATGAQALSADELAVANQLGLTAEQFAKEKENT